MIRRFATLFTLCLCSLNLTTQAQAAAKEISGQITIASGVKLKPGGVLYVFAKESGQPMPVAVLRIPNPQLPYKFTIGEKDAMMPGTPFTGPFILSARYAPSGDAMDKSGPEGSEAKPIPIGTTGAKIELKARN